MKTAYSRRGFLGATAALAGAALPGHVRAATRPLTMQAAWIADAESIGYFVGLDRGYYAEAGLDLEYLPGGIDVIPEGAIIAGRADLALSTPDTTIKAIAQQGAPFRIIGAQYQKSPIGVVSLARNRIREPGDLTGKTLAVPPVNLVSARAMLRLNGIDPARVNIVPYSYDTASVLRGTVSATVDFVTKAPFAIEQAGEEASFFLLYDFGYTLYNNTVVVTEAVLEQKRDLLKAWLAASRRGWAENLADPALWPPKFADTWFRHTRYSNAQELYCNLTQKPLMEASDGYFAMTGEGIEKCLSALGNAGIKGRTEMFDTSLLDEIA